MSTRTYSTRGTSAGALRFHASVLALVATCAAISGCSEPQMEEDEPWNTRPFSELVAELRADAEAGGAGAEQLAMLEAAAADGEVPIEAARAAMRATIQCFAESGLEAEYLEVPDGKGFVIPNYRVAYPETRAEEEVDGLIATCDARESEFINQAYQLQPEAREMLGEHVMSQETVLRECLEGNGLTTDPDATGWDLANQAVDVMMESEGAIDCLQKAKIDTL